MNTKVIVFIISVSNNALERRKDPVANGFENLTNELSVTKASSPDYILEALLVQIKSLNCNVCSHSLHLDLQINVFVLLAQLINLYSTN